MSTHEASREFEDNKKHINRITPFFNPKDKPINRLSLTKKKTPPPMPNSRFGTHMIDDSMEPEIFEGDLLMIDPRAIPKNGDLEHFKSYLTLYPACRK